MSSAKLAIKPKINRPARLVIMLSLFLIFVILAPAIILYTAGYRYNWKEGRLEGTGVINIDVKPETATVELNHIIIKKKIPIWLPNRTPGTYYLKISQTGYKTWEKYITVESNRTTFIKNVSLLKIEKPKLIEPAETGIIEVYISGDGATLLFLVKKDDSFSIIHRQIQSGVDTILTSPGLDTKPEISIAPGGESALWLAKNNTSVTVTLINLLAHSERLTISYPAASQVNYQWTKDRTSRTVYVEHDGTVERISLDRGQKVIAEVGKKLWFFDETQNFWTLADGIIEKKINNNQSSVAYTINKKINKIIDINKDRLILAHDNGILIIKISDKGSTNPISIPSTHTYYQTATREWWAWSDWELWSIYDNGEVTLLNRNSEKINDVNPLDEFGVTLLTNDTSLTSFNPGYYITQEIYKPNQIDWVETNYQTRSIYFIGKIGEETGLFKLLY